MKEKENNRLNYKYMSTSVAHSDLNSFFIFLIDVFLYKTNIILRINSFLGSDVLVVIFLHYIDTKAEWIEWN